MKSRSVAITGIFALAIAALLGSSVYRSLAASLAWHMRHAARVPFDGHTLALPILWHPIPGQHSDSFELERSTMSGGDLTLSITKKRSSGFMASTDAARVWQQKSVSVINRKRIAGYTTEAYEVNTKAGPLFCIGSIEVPIDLRCRLAGTDWDISFGSDRAMNAEVRKMLSTLE